MASLSLPLACSTKDEPAAADDSGQVLAAEDGSTAPCTDLGGACVTFQVSCPVEQQNPALCGDSLLICCLPEGGAILVPPAETGPGTEGGPGPETGPPPIDAGVETGSNAETGAESGPGPEPAPEPAPEAGPETGPVEASSDAPTD